MTKKHIEEIAHAFCAVRRRIERRVEFEAVPPAYGQGACRALRDLAMMIGGVLTSMNERIDYHRFLAACNGGDDPNETCKECGCRTTCRI